jgi:hypothetical protein
MSLPNFVCIGAQKAGTTWLYEMLSQNPSIWLPPLKEVHFFDTRNAGEKGKQKKREKLLSLAEKAEKRGKAKGSKSGETPTDGWHRKMFKQQEVETKSEFLRSLAGDDILTDDWYRRIFSHPDAVARMSGEITPAYLVLKEQQLAHMKSLLPDAKIVLLVRDPYARNVSEIKMSVARSKLTEPTDAEWRKVLEHQRKADRGNYKRAIPLYQKYYAPEQLLILPFSLVKTDPGGMIQTIESFVGAKHFDGYKALSKQVHKTKEVEVPEWVLENAASLAEPQKQYLIETFGADFYEKTK